MKKKILMSGLTAAYVSLASTAAPASLMAQKKDPAAPHASHTHRVVQNAAENTAEDEADEAAEDAAEKTDADTETVEDSSSVSGAENDGAGSDSSDAEQKPGSKEDSDQNPGNEENPVKTCTVTVQYEVNGTVVGSFRTEAGSDDPVISAETIQAHLPAGYTAGSLSDLTVSQEQLENGSAEFSIPVTAMTCAVTVRFIDETGQILGTWTTDVSYDNPVITVSELRENLPADHFIPDPQDIVLNAEDFKSGSKTVDVSIELEKGWASLPETGDTAQTNRAAASGSSSAATPSGSQTASSPSARGSVPTASGTDALAWSSTLTAAGTILAGTLNSARKKNRK